MKLTNIREIPSVLFSELFLSVHLRFYVNFEKYDYIFCAYFANIFNRNLPQFKTNFLKF
jgi:hypothetical protein